MSGLLNSAASQDGWTPLRNASGCGHLEVVDRLIAARAMVDAADKVLPHTRQCHLRARTTDAASRQHCRRAINPRPTRADLL
jgi:hypothetical protein